MIPGNRSPGFSSQRPSESRALRGLAVVLVATAFREELPLEARGYAVLMVEYLKESGLLESEPSSGQQMVMNRESPQEWLVDMNPNRILMSAKGAPLKFIARSSLRFRGGFWLRALFWWVQRPHDSFHTFEHRDIQRSSSHCLANS